MASPAIIGSRYEIRGIVGRGGMGIVYKAFDRVVGRDVALKTVADIQGKAGVEMFYKEWQLLANLHHPNIIEIFDIGEFDDGSGVKPFFVMPLLPGTTLDSLLRLPDQKVTPERLGEIVAQVCRGLQAIHDSGLIHRDIKPSNIFVMEFNAVKLIDFGVAHLMGGNTVTGLKGTVSYMAPEQIMSQECSPASDVFSLGVVCYEAMGGARPFQGRNSEAIFDAILHQIPPPICELNPAISQSVSRVIHRSLAKQPRHRYASALEFADHLQRALRGEPIAALDPSRIQPRIQRAIRAFEQGNYQMATDILSDLEAAGHIDPALKPLRSQIDQALQRNNIRDLLNRAQMGIEEEEYTLALQNAEAALKIEPTHEEAIRLRDLIQTKIAERDLAEWLRGAEEAIHEYAFTRARQLLRKVLETRPGAPQAAALFEVLENREHLYRAARMEKEELYKSARDAWENSDFATAAAKLERVLQLEISAPDTTSPESGANYRSFLSMVRSAQTIVENTKSAALDHIAEGRYDAAIELCRDCTSKYPGHPVPQGLALMAEAERKAEALGRMSETIRAISAEADIEKKLELLKRAMEAFPGEPLFEQWMRPVRDRLAQVRAIVAKAQAYEERGQRHEAAEQWRMIETIYPEFPEVREVLRRIAAPDDDFTAAAAPACVRTPETGQVRRDVTATPAPAFSVPADPEPVPAAAPPLKAERAKRWNVVPAVQFWNRSISWMRSTMGRSAAWAQPRWITVREWLRKSPQLLQRGRWALAAGLALVVIVASALIANAVRKPLPARKAAPGIVHAKVVLRGTAGDEVIRFGDKAVDLSNGEARTELAPGSYILSIEKDGYEPFFDTVQVEPTGLSQALPALRPLAAVLYVSTDFAQGRVTFDSRPPINLLNGECRLDDVAPGPHTMKLTDGRSESKFEFSTADGQVPEVKGPIHAKDLQVVAVTGLGRTARVMGPGPTVKVATDDGRQPVNEADVFVFKDLPRGPRQLIIGEGKDERHLAFDAGAHPLARFWVSSDRNVGSMSVKTGLERFQVFLDGAPYNNVAIREGIANILNLPVKSYRVRVAAEGYEPMQEAEVQVKKGGLASAIFKLIPVPQFAALSIRGLPPRTQVTMEGILSGAADAEGSFSGEKIPPGEHTLEFRNPRYQSLRLARTFVARETLTIIAADVRMEGNPGTANIKVTPETADLEIHCGQGPPQHFKGSVDVPCMESQVFVTASAEGYISQSRTVAMTPGLSVNTGLILNRIPAVAVAAPKRTCGTAQLGGLGWNAEQEWFTASSDSATLPCEDVPGAYEYSVRLPKGIKAKPVIWRIKAGNTTREFVLEKKSFYIRGGSKHEIAAAEKDAALTLRIVVEPGRVVHQVREADNSWRELESTAGDFRKIKIQFAKDARISALFFKER